MKETDRKEGKKEYRSMMNLSSMKYRRRTKLGTLLTFKN